MEIDDLIWNLLKNRVFTNIKTKLLYFIIVVGSEEGKKKIEKWKEDP
jgi:hypothetical protein